MPNQWQQLGDNLTYPVTGSYTFEVMRQSSDTSVFYVDDASVGTAPPPTSTPTATATTPATATLIATATATSTTVAATAPPTNTPTATATATATATPKPNQLTNPGFETGSLSPWWILNGNTNVFVSTAKPHSGSYGLSWQLGGSGWYARENFSVPSAGTYATHVWIYPTSSSTHIALDIYTASYSLVTQYYPNLFSRTSNT